jgi:uncharacterized protein (DUF58 family)
MKQLWKKYGHLFEAGLRHQVTRSGLVFTALILMVGLAAFISANNLLFLLLAAMMSTLMISGLISRLGIAGLELEFQLPEHVSARRKATGRVIVRNNKRWMTSFSVRLAGSPESGLSRELYFALIPGGARIEEIVEAMFSRRGIHKDNSFQFSTRFPFGFTERRAQVRLSREVLVYPCIDPQPGFDELALSLEGDIQAHFRGRGHDFYRIRPYEPTESARHVDWRATAHTGDLQVREFAREQENLVEVFLDLNSPAGREQWFEKAIDCCAFLCWRLAQRGSRIRFVTQSFDLRVPEEGDVYTILKYLALAAPARARAAVFPHDANSFRVVFSASASHPDAWDNARLLGEDAFSDSAGQPRPDSRGRPHRNHRGG